MFDVGFAELILLFIIGLLVLGPERLPKVARTLGGLTRKARSSWLNLKRSIEDEIRAEEIRKPLEKFQSDMRSKVDDMSRKANTLRDDVLAKTDVPAKTEAPAKTENPAPDVVPEKADGPAKDKTGHEPE